MARKVLPAHSYKLIQLTPRQPRSLMEVCTWLWGMDVFCGPVPLLKLTVLCAFGAASLGAWFICG